MGALVKQMGLGGVIGLVVGILGSCLGLAAAFSSSITEGVILSGIVVFVFGIFWKLMVGPMVQTQYILDHGEPAEATVLSVHENGSSLKLGGAVPKPRVTMRLEVRPAGKPPYHAAIDTFISVFEIQAFRPGKVIRVKYNPTRPQQVAIIEGAS